MRLGAGSMAAICASEREAWVVRRRVCRTELWVTGRRHRTHGSGGGGQFPPAVVDRWQGFWLALVDRRDVPVRALLKNSSDADLLRAMMASPRDG